MSAPKKPTKQKTLYGRYDDYAIAATPEGEADAARTAHTARAVRLVDTPAASRRGSVAGAVKRAPVASSASGDVILCVEPAGDEGELLRVTLETAEAAAEATADQSGSRLRREVLVAVEQYAALGLHPGGIDVATTEALLRAGSLCAAIRKGIDLLSYGDTSARTLAGKLTRRGIDREIAAEAVAYLADKGLLCEEPAALGRATEDARKGWGLRRIRQDLLAHGYTDEAASAALAALGDPDDPSYVDFYEACAEQVRRRSGRNIAPLTDRAAREKLVAALLRQGYSGDEIREAMRSVAQELARGGAKNS